MTEWPADRTERWTLDRLTPYAKNARTHSPEQIAQIAASIREFGFTNPILVDEAGRIVCGHGRFQGAREAGLVDVPVMVARGWSEAQIRAYVIADNKLALNAGWDMETLALELGDLRGMGFDLALTGFSPDELTALLAEQTPGLTDPDDTPELEERAVSAPGDVWLLGGHRLVCGDASNTDIVDAAMRGEEADLCFTSPPYGNQRDYTTGGIADWDALMCGVFGALPMRHGGQVLVNLGLIHRDGEWQPYWDKWIEWMRGQGWRRFGWYVWDQGFGLPGSWQGRLAPSHEFVFHFNHLSQQARKSHDKKPDNVKVGSGSMRHKDGKVKRFGNDLASLAPTKIPDSVIRVTRQQGAIGDGLSHPAPFPVALCEEMIAAYSDVGNIVFEPFSGSGSLIIAAEKTARQARAVELAPIYCDVAVRRWQSYTGKQATRERDGRTFEDIST